VCQGPFFQFVILVLELDEAPSVFRLVDVLLVAGAAECRGFRGFHVVVAIVLLGMEADQDVGNVAQPGIRRRFEQVRIGRANQIVGIAAILQFAENVAERTRTAGIGSGLRAGHDLRAGHQRNRFVASGAIAGRIGPSIVNVIGLYRAVKGSLDE